jgi:WD40 repeat protein
LEVDPSGELVAVSTQAGNVWLMSLAGDRFERLENPPETNAGSDLLCFSPDGRYLAAAPARVYLGSGETIRVWDLESGEGRIVATVDGRAVDLRFIDDRTLHWAGTSVANEGVGGGEKIIDLVDSKVEDVSDDKAEYDRSTSAAGDFTVSTHLVGGSHDVPETEVRWTERTSGATRRITSHGPNATSITLDRTEQWMVTGGYVDHIVRYGPVSGDEPHLFYGHSALVTSVAVSPDGRWIASGSYDFTARLWPTPDMSKPPLHTLPHDELIAKLKTLTNLRVVRDEESSTGWKLEIGPFPGWATVPEW